MNREKYSFVKRPEIYLYEFISEGPKGKIKKTVRYSIIQETPNLLYNLGFGDWIDAEKDIDDLVVTNNDDKLKVLTTVAESLFDFTRNYPEAMVFVQGSTPSRTRLYQMGLSSIWEEIKDQFSVNGYVNNTWCPYERGVNYESFIIKRK